MLRPSKRLDRASTETCAKNALHRALEEDHQNDSTERVLKLADPHRISHAQGDHQNDSTERVLKQSTAQERAVCCVDHQNDSTERVLKPSGENGAGILSIGPSKRLDRASTETQGY